MYMYYKFIPQLGAPTTMRCFYLIGVTLLAYIAGGDVGVLAVDVSDQHQAHDATKGVVSTTRLLRTRTVMDEERWPSVSVADKLAKALKSSTVTDEQLQTWLSQRKTAESVFYRMNLENTYYTTLFENPQFLRWLQYADDLSAAGKGVSPFLMLSKKYGDEKVCRMIGWAKQEANTEILATRLQKQQLEYWVKVGKDPDEVFKLYHLNYAGWGILSNNYQFTAWTKYVDDLNAKNEGAMVSIIPTLRKHISDDDMFNIAVVAKRSEETEAIGTKLEDAFVQFWIQRKDTPDNVLVELGLKRSTETLLENPLLDILTKYTEVYNVKYAAKKTTMIETLTRTFDDETVAKLLLAGREKSTTKEIAKDFQADQLEMWMNSGQSVDDVYKLLNLPSSRDILIDFGNQKLFNTWLTYMNAISVKNPEKTSAMFSTLAPTFNDRPMMQILEAANKFPSMEKAATKLQLKKAQSIFSTGKTPDEVFSLVALDEVGESVLGSPLFKKWMAYVEDFNKNNSAEKKSWSLSLRRKYQDRGLDKIIDKGMNDPSTMKLAQLVEKERMNEWLVRWKTPPNKAFRELHLDEAAKKGFSSPKFQLWAKYLDDWNQAYPSEKVTMIDEFRAIYDDFTLIRMLTAVEKVPNTKKLVSQLKDALADKWVAEKKTLDDVKSLIPTSNDMLA